jgi:putative spermidine/putrescine transport system permease protein
MRWATKFEVLPITIYSEFTNYANFALAASLSIALGLVTWVVMYLARRYSDAATVLG